MSVCPIDELLASWLDEALDSADQDSVARHVSGCSLCQRRLDSLTAMTHATTSESRGSSVKHDLGDADANGSADSSLISLMSRLRQHPPGDWTLPENGMSASSVIFAGPVSAAAPLGWLNSYQILRELGSGVTGQVFEARDSRLGRLVAVKVLRPQLASQPLARARFEREARAVATIEDQHIVRVFEVGTNESGVPFIVMEFVAGESLDVRLRRERTLAPSVAAEIVRQVGEGLEAAHRRQIVHRDIKPSNVLLDAGQGGAKLADFGLARVAESSESLTQEGLIAGTPAYMSPEQIQRPSDADARSDVYSLGVLLYETLTGERPFRGVMRMVLFQALHEEPVPPRRLNDRIPRDLETICLKAMSREPARRYASAAELVADLQRFLAGQPVLARPLGAFGRTWRWCRRNPKLAFLNGVVATVLIAGAVDLAGNLIPAKSLRHESKLMRQEVEQRKHQSEKQRRLIEQLAQLLVFDAQEALAEMPSPKTPIKAGTKSSSMFEVRRALLNAAIESLSASGADRDELARQTVAVAHNRLGDLARQENDWLNAERSYRTALELIDVTDSEPMPQWSLLFAETLANLGEVVCQRKDFDGAEKALNRARQTASDLARSMAKPSADQTPRPACWELMARCDQGLLEVARLNEASSEAVLTCRRRRIEVLGDLASDTPDKAKWRHELARELLKLADHEWQLDRQLDALRDAQRGWKTLLLELEGSESPSVIRERITVAGQLSNYLIETKSFPQARPILERGLVWSRSLLELSAPEVSDQQSLIRLERNLAFVEAQVGEHEAARRRLAALGLLLNQLLSDRRFAQQPDLVEWTAQQQQQVRSLLNAK